MPDAVSACRPGSVIAEECAQGLRRPFRPFLDEEVAAFDRPAPDVRRPGPPEFERTARIGVPCTQWPGTTPKGENRTRDSPPRLTIRDIMLVIDGRGRPIFFTNRVDMGGIAQGVDVSRP